MSDISKPEQNESADHSEEFYDNDFEVHQEKIDVK